MKLNQLLATVALVGFSSFAMANDVEVAPKLGKLNSVTVGSQGKIVKELHRHPFTDFLVTIPVTIQLPNVCTTFVGQETTVSRAYPTTIAAVGATNPLTDACIEILAEPVETKLTFNVSVLTGGIVAANPIQDRLLVIHGAGTFNVRLDLGKQTVEIKPIAATNLR